MNTGVRRSGATPPGASTTTAPPGLEVCGKLQKRKDMTAIAVAHHIPYVAQASISHRQDLSDKAARGAVAEGPAFLNVLSSCQLGWRHEPRLAVSVLRLAVESRFWPPYEVVNGRYRLTEPPPHPVPVEARLRPQGRFAYLFREENRAWIEAIQTQVDRDWAELEARCQADGRAGPGG